MDEKQEKYLVKSAMKALQILEVMTNEPKDMRVKDLSEKLNMEQSAVYRFLTTLEYMGYVKQSEKNGKYSLTLKLFELGNNVMLSVDLHSQSLPILQELSKNLGETIHLTVLDNGEAVFINKLGPSPTLVTYSYIGKRSYAHCIAAGKVLLAYLSSEELEDVIRKKGLPQFTDNTITSPEKLKRHLAGIRNQGVAYDFEEYEPGVNCVAAPIKNHIGQVVAAVSVSGSSNRLNKVNLEEITEKIKLSAQHISQKLGYNY